MKLDQTTVPLAPRTTTNCLDLAGRFFAAHFLNIGEVWLSVAFPAGLLAYLLCSRLDMDVRLTLAVLYFASMPLGVLIIAGTSRALFGDPFAPKQVASPGGMGFGPLVLKVADAASVVLFGILIVDHLAESLASDLLGSNEIHLAVVGLLVGTLSMRLALVAIRYSRFNPGLWRVLAAGFGRRVAIGAGLALLLYPSGALLWLLGIAIGVVAAIVQFRTGFHPEATFLAKIDRQLRSRKTKDLLKKEGSDLFLRGCWILWFCWMFSLVLFITVDFGSELLLGFPILFGRLQDVLPEMPKSGNIFRLLFELAKETITFAMSDPRSLAVLTAVTLIAYSIARIAWFFCYIDLRVRRDLWDLEIQFQQEAQRLERRTE